MFVEIFLMNDTPQYFKDLQLKIWLEKTPEERLYQTIKSNEELFLFWKEINNNNQLNSNITTSIIQKD